jgi:energy-coupling factor transport system ATP-binding protein
MNIIELQNVKYTYSRGTPFEKTAIEDITLGLPQGEFIGVIGHTGSGKSTLVQHLNGLMRPSAGKVLLDGKDIWAQPEKIRQVRFEVGLVFQYPEYQLFEETVYKDIAFGPTNMGLSEEEIDRNVREAALMVGIEEGMLGVSPFELSGGQKRRVAIAGVLAMKPRVLVLDEPTAGLDPQGRDEILSRIHEYHKEAGTTVVLVSHSMEDVARHSDRVLVISHAKVAMYDETRAVFERAHELEAMGLDIPQITKVFMGLRDRGLPVPGGVYTIEDAQREILRLAGERGMTHA